MAANIERERASILAEEQRLAERRKELGELEQVERQKLIGRSSLMKADQSRLDQLLERMKQLGLDETKV